MWLMGLNAVFDDVANTSSSSLFGDLEDTNEDDFWTEVLREHDQWKISVLCSRLATREPSSVYSGNMARYCVFA